VTASFDLPIAASQRVVDGLLAELSRPSADLNLGLWLSMLLPRCIEQDRTGQIYIESRLSGEARAKVAALFTRQRWTSTAAAIACDRQRACAAALARGQATARLLAKLEGDAFLGPAHPDLLGVSFHHHWGAPRLAGSAIRGAARAAVADQGAAATELFGSAPGVTPMTAGALTVFDGIPVGGKFSLALEVQTPHTPSDYLEGKNVAPAEWWSPRPFTFLVVRATTFAIDVVAPTPSLIDEACAHITEALEQDGIGGKTSAGFGRIRVTRG
jgi:CRISPR-associated protein Cmr6